MRKIALLLFALLATPASAGVTCSLPFNLQNGTTADATQVMANYNALVTCLGNAAASGVNNDITALAALSTPLTPGQGGTPVYSGGTSAGSANDQVVSAVTPSSFGLAAGSQVTFYAGFTNTGPTTLNVASAGATNIYRRTQLGISALVGGEIVIGHAITVLFDGTQFQLISSGPYQVGAVADYVGSGAPPGWVFIDGSCQLRVGVFADLYGLIGATYDPTGSTCDSAHFALPDGRGRLLAGRDDMGGSAANRITNAGSTCVGTTLGGAGCGSQNTTLVAGQMPQLSVSFSGSQSVARYLTSFVTGAGSAATVVGDNGTASLVGTVGSASPTAAPTLNPLQIVNKIIKY